ncbi:NADH:flavin oxidoreductase [Polaromonas sp. CF318]|uniref:helix-turn-helix domain-containing protein n=1 Tax=Polaromonas sp. CF318 TaxID=1144318 RepID=UPI0002714509|nr:helix-turn-helix domain-containing protein [Polaromonas sp. CF318]EJL78828.1 NADH:flavin oxidoreductase [Polaromonas sp. CF318]
MRKTPPSQPAKPTPVLIQAALQRLGKRLGTARKARQLTQEDLAHQSDVGTSTVRAIEAGMDGVSMGNFLKVMRGLQLLEEAEQLLDPKRDPEMVTYALKRMGRSA